MKTKAALVFGAETEEELQELVDAFVDWFMDGGGEQEFGFAHLRTSLFDGAVFAELKEEEV